MSLSEPVGSRVRSKLEEENGDSEEKLLKLLSNDLKERKLKRSARKSAIEQLKTLTRSLTGPGLLSTRESLSTLGEYAFGSDEAATKQEALKCLANILLLDASARSDFVDLGYGFKVVEVLKNDNRDDEFLASRLLFLCTYSTSLEPLLRTGNLSEILHSKLSYFAKLYYENSIGLTSPMRDLALAEILKLLFNLSQFNQSYATQLSRSATAIFKILSTIVIPQPPLQTPVTLLINALMNLDLTKMAEGKSASAEIISEADAKAYMDCLLGVLDSAVRIQSEGDLDRLGSPLVLLLRKLFEIVPEPIRELSRTRLLPSHKERDQPLGKSDTVAAYLLRLSSSGIGTNLRTSIQNLLFELSDKDAKTFIRNVGYGFASGFLMNQNIPVPEDAFDSGKVESMPELLSGRQSQGDSSGSNNGAQTPTVAEDDLDINPVTGQRRAAEVEDVGPPMTEEEKEREAERLFVLFERLRATGVVNVENPVTKAMREGRFEDVE